MYIMSTVVDVSEVKLALLERGIKKEIAMASQMEKRIRKSSHGGFVAEWGIEHKGRTLAPNGIGYTMPAFIVYREAHYDTLEEAERAVSR